MPWKVTANRRDDGSSALGCQHSIWKKNRLAYKLKIFSVQKFIQLAFKLEDALFLLLSPASRIFMSISLQAVPDVFVAKFACLKPSVGFFRSGSGLFFSIPNGRFTANRLLLELEGIV